MVIVNSKKRKTVILLLVTIIVGTSHINIVYGSDFDEEKEAFLNKYHFVEIEASDQRYVDIKESNNDATDMVLSIDINHEGMLALLLESRSILIYDKDFSLIHRYQLKMEGDYVKWFHHTLLVYGAKPELAVMFDLDGSLTGVYKEDTDYSSQLWKDFLNEEHIVGRYSYYLSKKKSEEKKAFWDTTPYPYVIRIDNRSGQVEVVYSAKKQYIIRELILWGIPTIILAVFLISYWRIRREKKQVQEQFVKASIKKRNEYTKPTGEVFAYAINQDKKEFIHSHVTTDVFKDSLYSPHPCAVLLEKKAEGTVRGRWFGDSIVWSDSKPAEEFRDISDLLREYYMEKS